LKEGSEEEFSAQYVMICIKLNILEWARHIV